MNKEQNESVKFRKYLLKLSLYPPKLKIKNNSFTVYSKH